MESFPRETKEFDAAFFEKLIFHNPMFEARSIKHANFREYAARVGDFIRSYDFTASMDFGACDGSCMKQVRDMVENIVLTNLFQSILANLLQEAMRGVHFLDHLNQSPPKLFFFADGYFFAKPPIALGML